MSNGILDIDAVMEDRDDYLRPNTPEWFSMVSLPYAFDADAECPRWHAFLNYNLEGDPERIAILQEWAGYLLLPDTGEQKFVVLEGEGSNGKSVYIAALTAMLGEENVSTVPLEVFGDRFSRTDTLGKLLNAAGDCGDLDKAAEGYLKSFTGGDRMFFDRKGVSGINCRPTARLMIACNNRPRFSDRSQGIWRRMLLIPWQVEITRAKKVKGMDKIEWWQQSGELPGIFRWALAGLARLRQQAGFTDSTVMKEALEDYQEEMNPAKVFLKANVEESEGSAIKSASLYSMYARWAKENGYCPLAERTFGKEVRRCFRHTERKRGGTRSDRFWFYSNLAFTQDEICGERTHEHSLF
jgi:P4 family phage/plasmid primase-like protien